MAMRKEAAWGSTVWGTAVQGNEGQSRQHGVLQYGAQHYMAMREQAAWGSTVWGTAVQGNEGQGKQYGAQRYRVMRDRASSMGHCSMGLVSWCFEPSQPQRIASGLCSMGHRGTEQAVWGTAVWGTVVQGIERQRQDYFIVRPPAHNNRVNIQFQLL